MKAQDENRAKLERNIAAHRPAEKEPTGHDLINAEIRKAAQGRQGRHFGERMMRRHRHG